MSKLEEYSKEEIIKGIRKLSKLNQRLESEILDAMNFARYEEAFQKAGDARRAAIYRMNEFFYWQKEMNDKYKDGNIPIHEFEKGVNLQNAWFEAEEKRKKLEAEEDKYCYFSSANQD